MAFQFFLSTILTLWLIYIYYGIGCLVFQLIRNPQWDEFEEFLLKCALGFGITGNIIMLFCFAGIARVSNLQLLLIFLSILTLLPFIRNLKKTIILIKRIYSEIKSAPKILKSILFVLAACYIAQSMLPPSGFDALMYHLSSADLYLKNGGFFNIFFNPQSDFPMLTEMNYMIGLALGNDIVCRQIALFTAFIACGSMIAVARFVNLSKNGIITCILLLLTSTSIIASVPECDVDMALASWLTLSVLLFLRALNRKNRFMVCVSMFLAGMAIQTKIFGVFVMPLLIATLFFSKVKYRWSDFIYFCLIPTGMGFPWFLKSLLNRNTIFSISSSTIIGQGLGNPMGMDSLSNIQYLIVNYIFRFLSAPWTFSIFPSQHQGDTFGPLLLSILPFLFFFKLNDKVKHILLLIGFYLFEILLMEMFFIQGGSSIRYSFFVLICGFPVVITILSKLKNNYRITGSIFQFFIWIQIISGSALLIKRYHKNWLALILNSARDEYFSNILPEYEVIHYFNNLPDSSAIFASYNYSNYLIKKPYICAYKKYKNNFDFIKDLKYHNVRYVFANNKFDTLENKTAYSHIENLKSIKSSNGFYLYELIDTIPALKD